MTDTEQKALYRAMRRGCMDAKDALARHAMRWGIMYAARYQSHFSLQEHEIQSIANMAVAKALDKWRPNKGALSTIVSYKVRGEINLAMNERYVVHIPRAPMESNDPISADKQQDVSRAMGLRRETEFAPVMDQRSLDPSKAAETADERAILDRAIAMLHPVDAFIVRRRFWDDATLKEVSADVGVCREAVRQREAKALRQLRSFFSSTGGLLRLNCEIERDRYVPNVASVPSP